MISKIVVYYSNIVDYEPLNCWNHPKAKHTTAWSEMTSANVAKAEKNVWMVYAEIKA
jgi:hypothetical protein